MAFILLFLLDFLPDHAVAPRSSGPCSDWFDNAWLKSLGYSADVCCWRNHTDCWEDDHTYASCCEDYDTAKYEHLLTSVGHSTASGELRNAALPLSSQLLRGSAIDGHLPESDQDAGNEFAAPVYATPRDFFEAVAPAATLALQKVQGSENGHAPVSLEGVSQDIRKSSAVLVLFVMTAPGNFARRQAIRRTWLQTALSEGAEGVRYAFVIGAPDATDRKRIPRIAQELQDEQAEFSDVLLLPSLQDVYWGWEHTAKTFLALVAVLARAPSASYYACLHDDVFVHVPRLSALLDKWSVARADTSKAPDSSALGLYLGNAYRGHDFVGHSEDDGPAYEAMHGHRKMPPVMKGGLWVVDNIVARWVAAMMSGPAVILPWRLWPSDDDSVGLVFGELDINRVHAFRHGIEWFDWRLGDRCDGKQLVVAHDLKTPRELFEMWLRQLAFDDPCYGFGDDVAGAAVRLTSRPEEFVFE